MRVAIVEIEHSMFGSIMRGRRDAAITSDWPEDAVIVGGEWDLDRSVMRLLVKSATFDEVPFGNVAPGWQPTLTTHAVVPSALSVMTLIDRMQAEIRAEA